jgi:hypothetical protein
MECGERLVLAIISTMISKGRYDGYKINHAIQYFHRIKDMTFEGNHFSTAAIITKSYYAYKGKHSHDRDGEIHALTNKIDLVKEFEINKRMWFLADGKTSLFIANNKLEIANIYILKKHDIPLSDYLDRYLMKDTIAGSDVLIRVINHNQMSIITSDGLEFINLEGIWHVRYYDELQRIFLRATNMDEKRVRELLFFVLTISQQNRSSILFIPNADSEYEKPFKSVSKQIQGNLLISDKIYTNTLLRIFMSDGVSIINRDGALMAHGAIVDLGKCSSDGDKLTGTGLTAAKLLGSYGTSIKISSDGSIFLFNSKQEISLKI